MARRILNLATVLFLLLGSARAEDPAPPPIDPVRVDRAVARAVEYLKGIQLDEGTWRSGQETEGVTALAILAALVGGIEPDSDPVVKAFRQLREGRIDTIYEASILTMALEALCRSKAMRDGKKDRPNRHQCRLSKKDQGWMATLTDAIVRSVHHGTWTYELKRSDTGPGRPANSPTPLPNDHSNTQFAVLGLRAASTCGSRIPSAIWEEVVESLLASQEGEDVGTPRGWSYFPEWAWEERWSAGRRRSDFGPTLSMTCVGIATLAIAEEALAERKSYAESKTRRAIDEATADALAWAGQEMTPALEDGFGKVQDNGKRLLTDGYLLYSIERVGMLLGKIHIGDVDWYEAGARHLLDKQGMDGGWTGYYDRPVTTAFAILFLVKATRPRVALTGLEDGD